MSSSLRRRLAACSLLAGSLFSANAFADCVFGTPAGGEPSLQVSLGSLLSTPPNVRTACLADGVGSGDAFWSSVGRTSATLLLEIAGFANINSFGIFDSADPANRLSVFSGPAGSGARAQITFGSDGTVSITVGEEETRSVRFLSSAFGFYLRTGEGNTLFSHSALNPGGADRMYAYRGNGARFTSGPITRDGDRSNDIFGASDAILAYEDLLNGDNDFQDFVVLVRGIQPIPLPVAAWLFGAGLLALGARVRRRVRFGTSHFD